MSTLLPKNLNTKTKELFSFLDKGLTIEQAYLLAKPEKKLTLSNKSLLRKKFDLYSFQKPERIQKASLAIDKTLSGEYVGDAKQPNASDILAAAKMVLDRSEPVINMNRNTSINLASPVVDLSIYLNKIQIQ